jgi:hypothetical protein
VRLALEALEERTVMTAVTGISPPFGSLAGGNFVVLSGSGFSNASAVSFGGAASPYYMVMSDGTISAQAPAHAASVVDITVTSPDGTSATTTADQFTYEAAPPVTTWTYLNSTVNPSIQGQNVVFTAMASNGGMGGTPTGTVVFKDGTTILDSETLSPGMVGAQATFSTSGLSVGTYTLTPLPSRRPVASARASG